MLSITNRVHSLLYLKKEVVEMIRHYWKSDFSRTVRIGVNMAAEDYQYIAKDLYSSPSKKLRFD